MPNKITSILSKRSVKLLFIFFLAIVNIILASWTIKFLKLAQRHLGDPLNGTLLLITSLITIFIAIFLGIKIWRIRTLSNSINPPGFKELISPTILFFNSLYWCIALLCADTSCIGCGGYNSFIYFWVSKNWLY